MATATRPKAPTTTKAANGSEASTDPASLV